MNDLTINQPRAVAQRSTGPQPIYPNDFDSAWRISVAISKSGLAPKGIQTPEAIFTAIQLGAEVGLSPMSALQNIAVVNGRPTIWGDAQLALVRASGLLEEFSEELSGEGDAMGFTCTAKRAGYAKNTARFTVLDAKTAGLWGKDGPWRTNPKRMLQMRARAFALRDGFTDILKGIYSTEEARDIPATVDSGAMPMATVEELNNEFLNAPEEKKAEVAVQLEGPKTKPVAEENQPDASTAAAEEIIIHGKELLTELLTAKDKEEKDDLLAARGGKRFLSELQKAGNAPLAKEIETAAGIA